MESLSSSYQIETRTLEEVNEVLDYASQTKTSLTRIMLDNMVVPLPNGDVDVSLLREAVELIDGRFETEVDCLLHVTLFFKGSSALLYACLYFLFFPANVQAL